MFVGEMDAREARDEDQTGTEVNEDSVIEQDVTAEDDKVADDSGKEEIIIPTPFKF